MQIYKIVAALLLLILPSYFITERVVVAQTKAQLKIRVLEQSTKAPVIGAVVMVAKKAYISDVDGYCTITYPASSKQIKISVKSLGLKDITDKVYKISLNKPILVYMQATDESLNTIYVSAKQKHTIVLQQAVAVDTTSLEKGTALSLGKLLESVPGLSTISSGSTIVKPVIQGMHSSRILLVNNGVRLESQSWGEDHAPEIDHTSAGIVEVVKGAEAIRYGYGAVGGVVLFNQAPLPYGHNKLKVLGKANIGYATNAKDYSGSGSIEVGYKNWGLRVHGMYQKAGDYSTAEYILNNTAFNNISFSALGGFQTRKLTATIFSSLYYSRSGIYYASHVSDLDQLLKRFLIGRPEAETFKPFSYDIIPPFQQSQHFTLKTELKWNMNDDHNLDVKFSYQDNLRQEFENRKLYQYNWVPVQDLMLTTLTTDAVWSAYWKVLSLKTQTGVSSLYQYNYNVPGTKVPAFIPNYAAWTMGAFMIAQATVGNMQMSAGLRYDIRAQGVNGYSSLTSYTYYNDYKFYENLTGSLATHYKFNENFDLRANIGWSWRPPDVNELYGTGLHHGTYWVVGNRNLDSEKGFKSILGGTYRNSWLSIEPSMFYQHVFNYIYDSIGEGDKRFHNHPSGKYPQFIFEQDDARFIGGDITATVVPFKGLSLSAKGEWINARNLSQDRKSPDRGPHWLPFMPSDRYGLSAKYDFTFGKSKKWSASLSCDGLYVTKQTHFDPAKDLAPESPDAYFLLNASADIAYSFSKGRNIKFMVVGDNVMNNLYKEYTDRFRFYAHARGANFSLRTIVNF